jgi:hypothetical protein
MKPTTESEELLVPNGHTMHSNTSAAVELVRAFRIMPLQLPAHKNMSPTLDAVHCQSLKTFHEQTKSKAIPVTGRVGP